ncbi:MAG TPA: protein kinase [Pyrinomonadaceae bacterium]
MKACPKCGAEYPDTTTLCPSDGSALAKTDDSLLGRVLADKYRIDERLSEGGMGTVYRGTHVLMDKTVAVKVLRPSLAADEKIVARFSREARAASKILHPHALSVTDFGEDDKGTVFLVMEFLNGVTLKDLIRKEGPMALPRVLEIMRQVGGALDEAHSQGVVHRDLKSDNIMLLAATSGDYAKVLDFGIAKIKEPDGGYDPGLTSPDLVIGTPQYMSPEQCSQSPDIDARSDIYSLGVILYEMFVGHVPFLGESPTAIMLKHLQHPAPSVLDERPDLPPAVDKVVQKAMQKRPENRYASIGELVEDLSMAAGIELPTPSFPEMKPAVPMSTPAVVDDIDEETLVRKRETTPMSPPPLPSSPAVEQIPPASSFNPWKILVPSAIGLLVVFGVIFLFTRNSPPATQATPSASPLVADPNSQPVEPASPATGSSEAGIPAGGATNENSNSNAAGEASPEPTATEDSNTNQQPRERETPIPEPTTAPETELPKPSPAASVPLPKPSLPRPEVSPPVSQPDSGSPPDQLN